MIRADTMINPGFSRLLDSRDLTGFEALWKFPGTWVEEPNQRRNGWSGVKRLQTDGQGSYYLKFLHNHCRRTFRHPLPHSTAYFEFRNYIRLKRRGIPVPEVVYFSEQQDRGGNRAILATRGLDDYQMLSPWLDENADRHSGSTTGSVLDSVSAALFRFHAGGFQHRSLYSKHVFVSRVPLTGFGQPPVRLIDFEYLRVCRLQKCRAAARDIYQLLYSLHPDHRVSGTRLLSAYLREFTSETNRQQFLGFLQYWARRKSCDREFDRDLADFIATHPPRGGLPPKKSIGAIHDCH